MIFGDALQRVRGARLHAGGLRAGLRSVRHFSCSSYAEHGSLSHAASLMKKTGAAAGLRQPLAASAAAGLLVRAVVFALVLVLVLVLILIFVLVTVFHDRASVFSFADVCPRG